MSTHSVGLSFTSKVPILNTLIIKHLCVKGGGKSSKNFLVFCFLSLFSWLSTSAIIVPDSINFRVHFLVNNTSIQTELFNNSDVLSCFFSSYNNVINDSSINDIRLIIRGSSSFEGTTRRNINLARNRAKVLFDYIVETYSIPASIITILPEQHQTDKDIYSTFPDSIPCIDIASIRNTNKPINISQLKMAFSKLDGVENGANWKWFDEHVLAPFRFAEISISFNRHLTNDVRNHTIIPTEVMPIQQQTLQSNMRQSLDLQIQPTIISSVHYKSILLKNNLIYDLGLVANLGAEFSIGNHYSIDIPVTFSPYNITKTIRCRSLIVQPALRYWFKENLIGMFVSLYGHYGYYDVALDGKTRWQNSWDDPMYGGGAGFGFAKRFGRDNRYGIEVEVGLGYAYLPSNFYYNIPNGAWYDFSAKHYWGPTKVNVGFSYYLSHKIRKSKGKLLHKL